MKLFTGPKLKIERAELHIAELKTAIQVFVEANKYPIVVKLDPKTGAQLVKAEMGANCVPNDFTIIAGDAIHNLRSALDLMMGDVARTYNPNTNKKPSFPFDADAERLQSAIFEIEKITSKEVGDILRRYEADMRTDGSLLRSLHKLDISDKHHFLTSLAAAPAGRFSMRMSNGNSIENMSARLANHPDSAFFVLAPGNGEIKLAGDLYATPVIVIGDGHPFADKRILETLDSMVDLTKGIVETFQTFCLRAEP